MWTPFSKVAEAWTAWTAPAAILTVAWVWLEIRALGRYDTKPDPATGAAVATDSLPNPVK